MKAIIQLDIPDWQIGQDVTVYFPDTMMKHGKCELLKEQEAVEPIIMDHITFGTNRKCSKCNRYLFPAGGYCPHCGRSVRWDDD